MVSIFDAYDSEFTNLAGEISKNISDITTYETDAGIGPCKFHALHDQPVWMNKMWVFLGTCALTAVLLQPRHRG